MYLAGIPSKLKVIENVYVYFLHKTINFMFITKYNKINLIYFCVSLQIRKFSQKMMID